MPENPDLAIQGGGAEPPCPPSRDVHRAIVRLIQELEAIDWYHAPIGVLALDVHGLILAWNGQAGEILGVREWEVLGTSLLHLFCEHERAALDRLIALCITTDTRCPPQVFERRTHEGQTQFVELTASGLRGRTGEPGATVLLQDVTERVMAERLRKEAEQRYRSLVQGIDAIVWEAEPETLRFTFVSQRVEDILGYPRADWGADPEFWVKHIHPDDSGRVVAETRKATAEGRDHSLEYRMIAADGREVWLRDKVTVLRDEAGHPCRLFGIMMDITERKRTEEALARLFKQAEQEAQRKDEFLAILSHELRNPLHALGAALAVLDRTARADDPEAPTRTIAGRQLHILTRLANDLLDIARVGSGTLQLERRPVDLNDAARHAIDALGSRLRERRHEVTFFPSSTPVVVEADPGRLEQVATNLLENAIKYTPPGGAIAVEVRAEGQEAVLVVRDNGLGIAPDVLPRIFDLFFQGASSQASSNGGLGLGLTLVRRLVEAQGGTIAVHSAGPGTGSEFIVRMPVSSGGTGRSERPPEIDVRPRRHSILIVDDDPDTRHTVRRMLELDGYEVTVAEDGPRGIEVAREAEPDVVLIDLSLPGLGGYEVAQHLRARRGPQPLLIAITGYSRPSDRQRAEEAGFDAFATKPVDPGELNRLITRG